MTHSTWEWQKVWARVRSECPDQEGVLAIDDTGVPKQGKHSVGVHRQYSGTLGKIGNCQIIVSSVLRAPRAIWPLAMDLYLPEVWTGDQERRDGAGIPKAVSFQTKWQIAIAQIDQVLAGGIRPSCVTADAGYGDCYEFRQAIANRGLPFSVGVSSNFKAFATQPSFSGPSKNTAGRPATRKKLTAASPLPVTAAEIADAASASKWRAVTWRNGTKGKLSAQFLILRVTPSKGWTKGRQHEECWLLCERPSKNDPIRKFYLSSLPADTTRRELVRITHERWAVEHNYRQLKDELGLDHFEGRSFSGFHRHLALTALAYSFLERERRRSRAKDQPTLNSIRRSTTEILTMLLFAVGERTSKMVLQFIRDPPKF